MKTRAIIIGIVFAVILLAYATHGGVPWKCVVRWDANPEQDLKGYRLTVVPVPATGTGWVYETEGTTSIVTVQGPGQYELAVSAFLSNGLESLPSSPIRITFDGDGQIVRPSAVEGLRLLVETTVTATVSNWIVVR